MRKNHACSPGSRQFCFVLRMSLPLPFCDTLRAATIWLQGSSIAVDTCLTSTPYDIEFPSLTSPAPSRSKVCSSRALSTQSYCVALKKGHQDVPQRVACDSSTRLQPQAKSNKPAHTRTTSWLNTSEFQETAAIPF